MLPVVPDDPALNRTMVNVRLQPSLADWLKAEAERHEVSVSEFARACIYLIHEGDRRGDVLRLLAGGSYRMRPAPIDISIVESMEAEGEPARAR